MFKRIFYRPKPSQGTLILPARIEVLIATHNRASLITETLDSVLSQHLDVLVRVVDDGSTDNTEEVLRPYIASGRVIYSKRPASGGPAAPRNFALKAVTAPYLTFFDADDLMQPGHLAYHLQALQDHPDWVGVVADYRNFSEFGDSPKTQFESCPIFSQVLRSRGLGLKGSPEVLTLPERETKLLAIKENFSSACGVIYKTSVAQQLGGFDEKLKASEDFDIFWRLLSVGPVGISTFCSFRRRVHAGNMSHELFKILNYKILSRVNILKNAETDPEVRRALKRALAEFFDALGYNQMPVDFRAGMVSAAKAIRYGAPLGLFPIQSIRAGARVLLRGA